MQDARDDTFKTRRELKKTAWARLHIKGAYGKLLLLDLLPMAVNVVFGILTAVSGLALGFSQHHLEQTFKLGQAFSDRFLWVVVNGLVSSLVAVIVDYVALDLIRHHNEHFTVGESLQHYLSWRYVLGFLATDVLKSIVLTILTVVEIVFAVGGVLLFPHKPLVALIILIIVIICAGGTVFVALMWSQTRFIMKDAIESGRSWTVTSLFRDSQKLMRGFCTDLFLLYWSLFGWILLEILSLGLAALFISPYVKLLCAAFYENLLQYDRVRSSVMQQSEVN